MNKTLTVFIVGGIGIVAFVLWRKKAASNSASDNAPLVADDAAAFYSLQTMPTEDQAIAETNVNSASAANLSATIAELQAAGQSKISSDLDALRAANLIGSVDPSKVNSTVTMLL